MNDASATKRWRAEELWSLSRRELLALLNRGSPISAEALAGREYLGVSLGLPAFVVRLTWQKFKKTFYRDPENGRLRGWNIRLEQNGLTAPHRPMMRRGQPMTFGHFEVIFAAGIPMPQPCDRGLLLDYGRGGNWGWDLTSLMRDPVVAVNAGDNDLLLGWSYLDLGAMRLGTPSFFTLQNDSPLSHVATPPTRA